MDIGIISIIISAGVAIIQLLNFLRAHSLRQETSVNDELDSIKKDINALKIENAICNNRHNNTEENMREQVRALEKLLDKLDCK